jgi:hypothetical protein
MGRRRSRSGGLASGDFAELADGCGKRGRLVKVGKLIKRIHGGNFFEHKSVFCDVRQSVPNLLRVVIVGPGVMC